MSTTTTGKKMFQWKQETFPGSGFLSPIHFTYWNMILTFSYSIFVCNFFSRSFLIPVIVIIIIITVLCGKENWKSGDVDDDEINPDIQVYIYSSISVKMYSSCEVLLIKSQRTRNDDDDNQERWWRWKVFFSMKSFSNPGNHVVYERVCVCVCDPE